MEIKSIRDYIIKGIFQFQIKTRAEFRRCHIKVAAWGFVLLKLEDSTNKFGTYISELRNEGW